MSRPVLVYALFLAVGVLSAVGDILLYKWARAAGWGWLAGCYAFWAASLLLFGLILRTGPLTFAAAMTLCTAVHLLIDVAYDVAVAGGRMTRLEWAGAAVAVAGILLMEVGRAGGRTADGADAAVAAAEHSR